MEIILKNNYCKIEGIFFFRESFLLEFNLRRFMDDRISHYLKVDLIM